MLTVAQARAMFDELATELPKQHLRLQFRKRFGTGELLNATMLKKAVTAAEREKPISNLLQELPEKLVCTRLTGAAEDTRAETWTATPDGTIGSLFSTDEVEQGLIVQGRKARLYAYSDPTEGTVLVLRKATELFGEEPKKRVAPKPISRSRKKAASQKRERSGGSDRR